MRIVNETPFAVGSIAVRSGANPAGFTLIVKGTFALAQDEAAATAPEQHLLCGDQFAGDGADRVCRYEDDFAPFKPRADLLLVGCDGRGEPASDTCRVGGHGAALASFGPVSRSAASRAKLAGANAGDWFEYHWPHLAESCPWDYFNAAPSEMQVEGYLQGNEEIALENLHPRHDSFRARLPGLKVRCFLKQEGGDAAEVEMNLDTLWLDAASDTLVLLWRGQAEANPDSETDVLVVSENLTDAPKAEAAYCSRLDAEEPVEEPAKSEKAEEVLSAAGGAPDGLPPEIRLALDDPEVGTPILAEQAKLDDPRFDGLGSGDGPADPNAGMDGVTTASGVPDASAPAPLKEFFAPQDGAEETPDNAKTSDEDEEPSADPDLIDAMSKQLAGLGLSQTAQDAVVAPEGPSSPKAASTGTLLLAGLEFGELPKDIQALLEDSTAIDAAMQFLDKIEPGKPPAMELPGEKAEQAIAAGEVPDWPAQSAAETETIAALTAAYGADRPPVNDGAMFLALLAHVAGEDMGPEPHEAGTDEISRG